jgi:hypothetical protein
VARFKTERALMWELRESRLRIRMIDASIRAHQVAGEQSIVFRLLRARWAAARAAARAAEACRLGRDVRGLKERP